MKVLRQSKSKGLSLSQSQQRLLLSRVEEEHDNDNDDNDNDDGGDDGGGDIYGDGNYDHDGQRQGQGQGLGQGRGRAGEDDVSAPVAVDAKSLKGMSTAQVQPRISNLLISPSRYHSSPLTPPLPMHSSSSLSCPSLPHFLRYVLSDLASIGVPQHGGGLAGRSHGRQTGTGKETGKDAGPGG